MENPLGTNLVLVDRIAALHIFNGIPNVRFSGPGIHIIAATEGTDGVSTDIQVFGTVRCGGNPGHRPLDRRSAVQIDNEPVRPGSCRVETFGQKHLIHLRAAIHAQAEPTHTRP